MVCRTHYNGNPLECFLKLCSHPFNRRCMSPLFLLTTFDSIELFAFWLQVGLVSKSSRSCQQHRLAPYCAEHISVKATIPPIRNQGTQSYCAHPLAKALQSGMSNDQAGCDPSFLISPPLTFPTLASAGRARSTHARTLAHRCTRIHACVHAHLTEPHDNILANGEMVNGAFI